MPKTLYVHTEEPDMGKPAIEAAAQEDAAVAEATEQTQPQRGRNMVTWWIGWFLIASGTLLFVASMLHH